MWTEFQHALVAALPGLDDVTCAWVIGNSHGQLIHFAIWGHVLMGWDLTLLSVFGVVALSGVVVNASLLMIDLANRGRRTGMLSDEAITLLLVPVSYSWLVSAKRFLGLRDEVYAPAGE